MTYVDGFLLPVPKKNLKKYAVMARAGARVWKKHGALDYKECVGDDLKPPMGMAFPKLVKPKKGETVVFSFITYKSRAHRDAVNKKVMTDPGMLEACKDMEMPFDLKRMCYGGFKVLVEA
jgi:uncharacterized protein YbaA (DUF1428 family)